MEEVEPLRTCGFCKDILDESRVIQLECGHTCHAVCILIDVAAQHQIDSVSRCPECNEYIVTHEMQTAMFERADTLSRRFRGDIEEETLDTLIESSEEFKKDFSSLKGLKKGVPTLKRNLTTKINEVHATYMNQVRDILTVLKGTHAEALKTVFTSEEFKSYKRQLGKVQTKIRAISRKYTIAQYRIENRLIGRRGRRFRRRMFNYNIDGIRWYIRRKFRIRIF